MAHPFAQHRQNRVEKSRVAKMTRGYASGGAVRCDEPDERKHGGKVAKHVREPEGKKAKRRADRVMRARGGKVGHGKKGATHVNVIVNGGDKGTVPVPMPPPAMAGPPPMPAGPIAGVGGPPPSGPPPGMPPMPGRASGGKVKSGPAWVEGIKAGTQVSHRAGKASTNTPENLDRGRPITFKSGGKVKSFYAYGDKVEAPGPGKGMGPDLKAGVMSGEGREKQAARAKRNYGKPMREVDGAT
jgi:hypothetical protein